MKNTWIVTTGNSDIWLNSTEHWDEACDRANFETDQRPNKPIRKNPNNNLYFLSSRCLGLMYGNYREAFDDLSFPLWDCFLKYLEDNNKPVHRIIVLLTDQEEIFRKQNKDHYSHPFWKDTVECEPLLKHYLQCHNWGKNLKPDFRILSPTKTSKGLDYWDSVLKLVRDVLADIECEDNETIYVSHQAGTPATSSALQFVSLEKFGSTVQFLVTNEYNSENTRIIESSEYLRAFQLQKAKKLIIEGVPGAALELLQGIVKKKIEKELKIYVDIFNIKTTVKKEEEFLPDNAGKRIRDALDLVEFFFQQENYLSGITLLIATQETFLKAAIVKLANNSEKNFTNYVQWNKEGLSLKSKEILALDESDIFTDSLLNLNTIVKPSALKNKKLINLSSFQMLKWLRRLIKAKNDWVWPLLDWSCFGYREHDLDRRNQLVHNLRGVDKIDVLCYLYSYKKMEKKESEKEHEEKRKNLEKLGALPAVKDVYLQEVKKPFVQILHALELCDRNTTDNLLKQKLKELCDRIEEF